MKFQIFFFLLFAGIPSLRAQATLLITTVQTDALIRIDGKLLETKNEAQPYEVRVTAGEHIIEIWKKSFQTEKKIVTVKDGEQKRVVLRVSRVEPGYKNYIDQKEKYDRKRILRYGFDIALSGTALYAWYAAISVSNNKQNELKARALEWEELYYSTIVLPDKTHYLKIYNRLNDEYQQEQKDTNKRRLIRYPVAAGITAVSLFFINRHRKNRIEAPVYNPQKAFSLIAPNLSNQTIAFGLAYTF